MILVYQKIIINVSLIKKKIKSNRIFDIYAYLLLCIKIYIEFRTTEMEVDVVKEIRNLKGKLVCLINEKENYLEIKLKGCLTRIKLLENGKVSIVNQEI